MELRRRQAGDERLPSGAYSALRKRLRRLAPGQGLRSVVVHAFDWRTRMLPFHYSSLRIAPAGVRAVGAALADAGFDQTRIVLQQWNRRFRPSQARLNGRLPDLLLVSSMQIHAEAAESLIRDACALEPDQRPLIIAGGPRAIFESWSLFQPDGPSGYSADVAVTGEEYVLLSLLEVVLSARAAGESMRAAFTRARDRGWLEAVPGLVYARGEPGGPPQELVDTGVQRLLGDMDELPMAAIAYRLLEPPSRRADLASQPLEPSRVRRFSTVTSLVLSTGCRFSCPYCPIPAYNQRQLRGKSGPRVVREITELYQQFGLRYYFGTDDNFFADRERARDICEALAAAEFDGQRLRRCIRWATEVTVHDTLAMAEHLPLARKAHLLAVWIGVEDMTATLVKKGQSVDKTLQAMDLLRRNGILAVPMLMHHDGQPLLTRGSDYGLLNQMRLLRRAGALDIQVLAITPAPGSKLYESTYESGQMIDTAAGRAVQRYMLDGNYVVASSSDQPWRAQWRMMLVLMWLYNPVRLLWALLKPKSRLYLIDAGFQATGMWGLLRTLPRMAGWMLRLLRGPIRRQTQAPHGQLPLRRLEKTGDSVQHAGAAGSRP